MADSRQGVDRRWALGLLGVGPDATPEEIERAYWAQCSELEARIRIAPTEALKAVYRESLEHLEDARSAALAVFEGMEPAAPAEQPAGEPPPEPQPEPPPAAAPPPTPPARAAEAPAVGAPSPPLEEAPLEEAPPPALPPDATLRDEQLGAISAAEAEVGFLEGRVLVDRYEVHRRIGLGSTGAVYGGFDRVNRHELAIRVILPELLRDEQARERFFSEARIASRLAHPSIPRVYDVQNEGALYFVTVELVKGKSLRQVMEERRQQRLMFSLREVQRIGEALCDALRHAHRVLPHRNIRPDNIFLLPDGSIKITDFEVSSLEATQLSIHGIGKPTAAYRAPEQLQGALGDHRSDQYSVAAVLYALLTTQVHAASGLPVRMLRRDVPERFAAALDRALQERPDDRFSDIGAFQEALASSGVSRVDRRVWIGAAGAVLALAAAAGGYRVLQNRNRTEEADRQARAQAQAAATRMEVEREATAAAAAEAERDATFSAMAAAERTAAYSRMEAERVATARARAEEEKAAADAAAKAEALRVTETRAAEELERAAAEVRAHAERGATIRARADAQRSATAEVRAQAQRTATARAAEEAERMATARAQLEVERVATMRAQAEAERTALARSRAEAERVATARAVEEAAREAETAQRAEAERAAAARAAAEAEARAEEENRPGYISTLKATVSGLRFFEKAQGEVVPEGKRVYQSEFDRERTRAVFWELSLTHPPQGVTRHFNIRSICYRPNGSVLGEGRLASYIEANWAKSTHVYGWGFQEPGHWQKGRYRVELFIEGKQIASGSFEID